MAAQSDDLPAITQKRFDELAADNTAGAGDQRDFLLLYLIHHVSPGKVTETV